jgi:hypothetical protein
MINTETFNTQNSQISFSIGNVQIRKTDSFYQVIANGAVYQDFVDRVFQINENYFHVRDHGTKKWHGYQRIGNDFEKVYESSYLIVLLPDLIIRYEDKMFYVCSGKYGINGELQENSMLFVGGDFKISKGELFSTNMRQFRVFRYDLKNRRHRTEIIQNGKNREETKKCLMFFDNIGGIEIYDHKKKLQWSASKFYRITSKLLCLKISNEYHVVDIENKKTIFTGSVIVTDNFQTMVIASNRDEIFVADSKHRHLRVYNWESFRTGTNTEPIKNYLWGDK